MWLTDCRNTTYLSGWQIPCPLPEYAQRLEDLHEGLLPERPRAEIGVVQGRGRRLGGLAPGRQDLREHRATVARVRNPADEPGALEPIDRVGDAGPVDLQALADLAQRQRATAGEVEQHQRLVAGE